ncbi:MAG: hypothetical protein ACK5MV_00030 [Aminipila sp.]
MSNCIITRRATTVLPTLIAPATSGDIAVRKQVIGSNGEIITGTVSDFRSYTNTTLQVSYVGSFYYPSDPMLSFICWGDSNDRIVNGQQKFSVSQSRVAKKLGITPAMILKGNTVLNVVGTGETPVPVPKGYETSTLIKQIPINVTFDKTYNPLEISIPLNSIVDSGCIFGKANGWSFLISEGAYLIHSNSSMVKNVMVSNGNLNITILWSGMAKNSTLFKINFEQCRIIY